MHNEKKANVLFSLPFSLLGPDTRLYPALFHSVIRFTIFNVKKYVFLTLESKFCGVRDLQHAAVSFSDHTLLFEDLNLLSWWVLEAFLLVLHLHRHCFQEESPACLLLNSFCCVCVCSLSLSLSILVSSLFLSRRRGTVTWFPRRSKVNVSFSCVVGFVVDSVFIIMSWFHCERACQWWDDCLYYKLYQQGATNLSHGRFSQLDKSSCRRNRIVGVVTFRFEILCCQTKRGGVCKKNNYLSLIWFILIRKGSSGCSVEVSTWNKEFHLNSCFCFIVIVSKHVAHTVTSRWQHLVRNSQMSYYRIMMNYKTRCEEFQQRVESQVIRSLTFPLKSEACQTLLN